MKVQVLAEGAGPEAAPGDKVLLDYVLRRRQAHWGVRAGGGMPGEGGLLTRP